MMRGAPGRGPGAKAPAFAPDAALPDEPLVQPRFGRKPGRGVTVPLPRAARPFDPRYRLAAMQRGMIGWSLFNAYFALLLTFVSNTQLSGAGFFVDFVLLLSCLLQLMVGSLLLRLPLRLPVAGSLLAILMTWSAATTLFANGDFGRALISPIQYYVLWGFFYVFIFSAVEMGVNLSPKIRNLVVVPWLAALAISGLVAVFQVAGFGWAMALSPSKSFGEIFRPTGIADYTFMLGMQGVFGMTLVGARLRERELSAREWLVVAFFGFVVILAQYRSLYYTGVLLTGVLLLALQFKRNRVKSVVLGLVGAGGVLALFLIFPQKLAYGLRGAANDPALEVRYTAWQQLKPVLAARPFTGIGADTSLMLTTSDNPLDHFSGLVIDNFYRMVLICYGYVGGFFMVLTFAALAFGLLMRYDASRAIAVKVYTIAGIIAFASLLGVSMTGNSFVYRQIGYSFAILLALGAPSWQERRLTDVVSPVVAWARTLARTPLRTMFPNLGRLR